MRITRALSRLAFAFMLLVAAALAVQEARAADASSGGPLAMVITYHTAPGNRVAFRQAMEAEVTQFERWRSQGVLESAQLMFSRHADSVGWDAMALITLARYADMERWKEIERERPAGLSQKTLALTTAVETVPGDLVPVAALAALPDEIQVYTSDINKKGEFGLELHVNTTPSGRSTPDFPGEIAPAHGWRLTPEFSYGITPALEGGLYLPLVFGAH